MLSLAGHPSLPSLRNSMRHPEHFEGMLDGSFLIMFVVYVAMAVFGFLSFGDASAVLVTENLRRSAHSAASRLLNKVVIFFVALSSASTVPPLIAVTAEMYDDIIDNLERDPEHYARANLTCRVGETDGLWRRVCSAGDEDEPVM